MHFEPPPSPTTANRSSVPTLAAAIAAVDSWTDFPPWRRASLKVMLQRVADLLGDPAALIVLSPSFVRTRLLGPSPSAFGLSENTFRSYRSAVRQAMERMGVIDARDVSRSPAWGLLLAPLNSRQKAPLAKLADFCALRSIEPDEITNEIFTAFKQWLQARTLVAKPKRLAGSCRLAWNRFAVSIPGWPAIQIEAPSDRHQYILPLETFTAAFQADLARFGTRLGARTRPFTGRHRLQKERPPHEQNARNRVTERGAGLRPISVQVRLGHVRWAASALVASGFVPIAEITSVSDLVQPPDRAHATMRYLFELRGQAPWPGAMHVLEVLMILAKYEAKLPEGEIGELREWRQDVAPESEGMSAKRRDRIRAVMEPHRLQLLLQLPSACMQQAMDLLPTAPREATSLAMRALAVQLLLTTQVRHFRPTLATDAEGYLFPGHGCPHIGRQGMRDAVKGIVKQVTGMPLGPHDFRGLVAKIHLHFNPGDYGTVMHLLGHTGLKTTMESYTVDEAERAAEDFDRTVLRLTRGELSLTKPPGRRESRKSRSPLLPPGGKPRGPWGRS